MLKRSPSHRTGSSHCWDRLAAVGAVAFFVAAAAAAGSSSAVDVNVAVSSVDRIVIEYEVGDFTLSSVDVEGQKFAEVMLPGEPQMKVTGAPAMPRVARSLIIADSGTPVLTVLAGEYYEIEDFDAAPSRGYISRELNPADVPYKLGAVYAQDAFFPAEVAALGDPYILRDYRGLRVDVFPLQYNPVSRTLRVYTALTIEVVVTDDAGSVNMLRRDRSQHELSLAFHQIYNAHFINYVPNLRYDPMDETGDMLIICYDAWMTNVQPFVDHKNAIGIDTTIVGVSTIGNNATSIKNHIQDVYDTSDLAFVLLVGDIAQVASPTAVSGYDGASDPSYALLEGGDTYPEIVVGRFSAGTSAEVDTQVERSIEYEQMPATQQTWFWKGTGVASSQGTGDDGEYDWEHMRNIRADLLVYDYTEVDELYDGSQGGQDAAGNPTNAMVAGCLNDGRGIINYCGHGGWSSWSTSGFSVTDVDALVNDNMLPFIVSVACNNGEFDNYTKCFGEAWLRATHSGEPTGGIGCYASSISQPWSPPMEGQDEFNLLYVVETYDSYGAYCFAGSCSMMDDYPGSSSSWGNGPATFVTWILFGDPSLRIVGTVAPPHGMGVTPSSGLDAAGPQGGPFAPDSIEYTLENYDEDPINYEVIKSVNWLDISNATGTIPVSGTAIVTVSINSIANSLDNGQYTDTVQFVNLTNHDGDTTRDASLTVGVPSLQYEWNLDTDPGWTTQGLWAWGQPTGGGGQYGGPDPTSGYTGSNVYGYNLSGDYENSLAERHLTTAAIDCTDLTDVSLRFWRWLGVEQPTYDHAYVRVSNNGSDWNIVWQNTAQVADTSWVYQEFDIAAFADDQPTVYLRWTMGTTDTSWQFCGWNIDDVEIWGLAPGGPHINPGDMNCDGTLSFLDIDPFVLAVDSKADYQAAYPECNWLNGDLNEDGSVTFLDIGPFVDLLDQ